MSRGYGVVLEFPLPCEFGKVIRCELRSVVADYSIWYAISREVVLQLADHCFAGEIIEFNEALEDSPEQVNDDPYGSGWMIKLRCDDLTAMNDLLTAADYKALIGA